MAFIILIIDYTVFQIVLQYVDYFACMLIKRPAYFADAFSHENTNISLILFFWHDSIRGGIPIAGSR